MTPLFWIAFSSVCVTYMLFIIFVGWIDGQIAGKFAIEIIVMAIGAWIYGMVSVAVGYEMGDRE